MYQLGRVVLACSDKKPGELLPTPQCPEPPFTREKQPIQNTGSAEAEISWKRLLLVAVDPGQGSLEEGKPVGRLALQST